jgi:hypothetical protein
MALTAGRIDAGAVPNASRATDVVCIYGYLDLLACTRKCGAYIEGPVRRCCQDPNTLLLAALFADTVLRHGASGIMYSRFYHLQVDELRIVCYTG